MKSDLVARKRKVVVSLNRAEYEVLQARAIACTQGNIAQYIRTQVFGEDAEARGAKGGSPEPSVQALTQELAQHAEEQEIRMDARVHA